MAEEIGKEARRLLERLEAEGTRFFDLATAVRIGGKGSPATVKVVKRLARAGRVTQLGRGRYGLGRAEGLDKLVVGRELAGGEDYFISYRSAMEVHGMAAADEGPVVVALSRRWPLKTRRVMGWEYRFVRDPAVEGQVGTPQPRPAGWMVMEVLIGTERIRVSDPEWTILSGLGRPELCGGNEALGEALAAWGARLDLEKLMEYAGYVRNQTAVRRLNEWLERLGLQTERTRLRLGLWKHTRW